MARRDLILNGKGPLVGNFTVSHSMIAYKK